MTIQQILWKAILSEASYADFRSAEQPDGSYRTSDVKTALINITGGGFSPTQAADFIKQWEVIDHQPNTAQGFSATLFHNIQTDTYQLVFRGTEIDGAGIIHDIGGADIGDIGGDGIAVSQAVDLFNYYQRLTHVPGTDIIQYAYHEAVHHGGPVPIDIPAHMTATVAPVSQFRSTELGALTGKTFTAVGHSLGGHLALIMSRLDPHHVDAAYTYNAPGFDTALIPLNNNTAWLFQSLAQIQTGQTGTTTVDAAGFRQNGLNNFIVPDDIISDIGTVPGGQTPIFDEATNILSAHKIGSMVDALAIYSLLSGIEPDKHSLATLTSLLGASSNKPHESLETTVNTLGDLLNAGTPISTTDNREDLYQRIDAIKQVLYVDPDVPAPDLKPQYQGLHLVPLVDQTAAVLAADAMKTDATGIATRYALVHGNPFAVTGNDTIYAAHNQNHELDLYDEATGQDLSDDTLAIYADSALTVSTHEGGDCGITHAGDGAFVPAYGAGAYEHGRGLHHAA